MDVLRARRFRRLVVLAALAGLGAYAMAGSGGASAAGSAIALPHLKFPVTNFVQYADGTAGAANSKSSPVLIGWVNNQGGQVLIGPTATQGAALAAQWINQHAGGIAGHPIKLVNCFITNTEAEGTTCGDKLAATTGVDAIAFGGVAVGADTLEAVVSPKIPIAIGVSISPSDNTNKNTYIFGGAAQYISEPWGTFASTVLHAKSMALLFPNAPGFTGPAAATQQGAQAAGLSTTPVALDPNATDYSGALQAANVAAADSIYVNGTPATCIEVAKALQQLNIPGKKVISSPLCLAPDVKKALGDFPNWYYGTAQDNLVASLPEVKAYYSLLAQYHLSASDQDPWFCTAFSEIMTLAQMANAVVKSQGFAKLSPTTENAALKVWRGPFILGQPVIHCGAYAKAPASCAYSTQFLSYANGKFTQASKTKSSPTGWMLPPPSLQPGG